MPVLVDELQALLRSHPLTQNVRIVTYDETPQGKLELKIRCRLIEGYHLQVWIHSEPRSFDYAYQLFADQPLLRWDNAPHYPRVPTAPHHFHDDAQQVTPSPLTGKPLDDLPSVLDQIADWLETRR
jgi:hypothetical protein